MIRTQTYRKKSSSSSESSSSRFLCTTERKGRDQLPITGRCRHRQGGVFVARWVCCDRWRARVFQTRSHQSWCQFQLLQSEPWWFPSWLGLKDNLLQGDLHTCHIFTGCNCPQSGLDQGDPDYCPLPHWWADWANSYWKASLFMEDYLKWGGGGPGCI